MPNRYLSRNIAVLTSGGIDSDILLSVALKKYDVVYPVYVRSGLIWEKAELFWLKKYLQAICVPSLKPLTILEMPVCDLDSKGWAVTGRKTPGFHSRDEEVYLPGRNLMLLAKAATFCALRKIPTIAIGSLSANPFPDATRQFFAMMAKTASQALEFPVRIDAPFSKLKKKDLLKKAKDLPLHLAFSCLSPKGTQPCHRCNKCAEKEKLLRPKKR